MKRSAELKDAIAALWSSAVEEQLAALSTLASLGIDMVDLRTAQPALTVLLTHPVVEVRLAALRIVEQRGDMGADIGMAVPNLLSLQNDEHPEVRELARRSLACADQRLGGVLAPHLATHE